MCLIVDANAGGVFLARESPILTWLFGPTSEPRLVVGGKLKIELTRNAHVTRRLVQLERAGRLRPVPTTDLEREERHLNRQGHCCSNDLHVLALARISGARTLATEDGDLTTDFRNKLIIDSPRGRVYRDPDTHAHLLGHTPSSCGVKVRSRS
jgi:hypothetical protein